MNIGIDGRILTFNHPSGLKTYAKNLIFSLSEIDRQNNYTIIAPEKIIIPKVVNFRLFVLKNNFPKFKRIIYEQVLLPNAVKKLKLDLLHCLDNTGPLFLAIPLVLTIHDLRFFVKDYYYLNRPLKYKFNDYYQRIILPKLINSSGIVICPSNSVTSEIKDLFQKEKVYTIYHGLDRYWKKIIIPKRENFFLFLTDYSPTKNAERVLESFKIFCKKIQGFSLIVVTSDNIGFKQVKFITQKLNLNNKVVVLNQISQRSLRNLYNQAFVLLKPSTIEGFGFPLIESMSCGCPVITSKLSSMPEIAGKAALYVNPNSTNDILNKMIEITENKPLKSCLIEEGYKNIKRFDWRETALKTLEIYRK